MARGKQGIDKTTRPEYIPLTIWGEYQEFYDESEIRAAFERVMFGDDCGNSHRAMERAWRAIETARKAKFQHFRGWLAEEYEDVDNGTYGTLAIHIRRFAGVRTEDFSNIQSPGVKAEQLRNMLKAGIRFLKQLESNNWAYSYDCGITGARWESINEKVLEECNRGGSRLDWAIREVSMDISIRDYGRESEFHGKDYLFSEKAEERYAIRRAILGEYEDELRKKIIPMVIEYTIGQCKVPLDVCLRDALEEMESDEYWVMRECHILPRPDVKDPRKTYVVRYFAGAFCTLFCIPPDKPLALTMLGEAGIVSSLGRFAGAMLGEEVTREDVKNILKGYPPGGISIKQDSRAGG